AGASSRLRYRTTSACSQSRIPERSDSGANGTVMRRSNRSEGPEPNSHSPFRFTQAFRRMDGRGYSGRGGAVEVNASLVCGETPPIGAGPGRARSRRTPLLPSPDGERGLRVGDL